MEIYGREVHLARTVGAEAEISEMCKDGNIANLTEFLFSSSVPSRTIRNTARFIAALSKAGESKMSFEDITYTPEPLSTDEILTLSTEEFMALQAEAMKVFIGDAKTTVEAEPSKKRKATAKQS